MKKIGEIFFDLKKKNKDLVFIFKIDEIENIEIKNDKEFKKIFKRLFLYINNSYKKDNTYKIILVTSKIDDKNIFFINLTFCNTKINKKKFLLKEKECEKYLETSKKSIVKNFNGKLKIISYKNRGRTIFCRFTQKLY